ncbi:hypothetical protein, partial [Sporichthya sp.]|uniref:hypothetical protein n=1 Tax=Sporichthya sp. TaxID=65475 RepID=UPI0017D8E681
MRIPVRSRLVAVAAVLALAPSAVSAAVSSAEVTPGPTPLHGVPQVLAPVDPATGTGPTAAGLGAA